MSNGGYRQKLVVEVGAAAFGMKNVWSHKERLARFFEEACELMRAGGREAGMSDTEISIMMNDIKVFEFNRPPGRVGQEIAGCGVTLYALAATFGHDLEAVTDQEILRIIRNLKATRAKHDSKPDAIKFAEAA